MGLPTNVICVSLLALLGVTTGRDIYDYGTVGRYGISNFGPNFHGYPLINPVGTLPQGTVGRYGISNLGPHSHGPPLINPVGTLPQGTVGRYGISNFGPHFHGPPLINPVGTLHQGTVGRYGISNLGPHFHGPPLINPVGTLPQGTIGGHSTPVSSQRPNHRSPPQPRPQDATEEPTTVLSGIYIPSNNCTEEFEAHIALAGRPTLRGYSLLNEFLQLVTQGLQRTIRSANLDPLTVVGLGFDFGNKEVKIEQGTFNGLSSVVLTGGLVDNSHGVVKGVRVSGDLGELMGFSGGFTRQLLKKYDFGVNSTIDSITVLMDVKLDKVACKLSVEDLNIKLGAIKVDVIGVPSKMSKIKDSVVSKFGFHLEKLLNSHSYVLKILSNTALSSIPKSDALKNILGCNGRFI